MADDAFMETPQATDEWDIDELLKEFEPEVEEAEKQADNQEAKNAKAIRKIAERQARTEERDRVEKLTGEFYANASDNEKELADVLLAGVSDEGRVKKMLDLAKAKAKSLSHEDEKAAEEAQEAAEEDENARAFAPVASGVSSEKPADQRRYDEMFERVQSRGDPTALLGLLAEDSSFVDAVLRGAPLNKKK